MAKGKDKGKKNKAEAETAEGPDREAEFEMLLTSKNLELAETKAKAERMAEKIGSLQGENTTISETLSGVKKDSSDILAHFERDMLEKRSTCAKLGEQVEALSTEVEHKNARILELEREREEASAEISAATRSIEEKQELENLVSELRTTIAGQNKTIQGNDIQISSLEQQLKTVNRNLDDLQLELSRSTSTAQVADHQWTLKRAKQRLKSANNEDESNIPSVRGRNSLAVVGRMAILFGGTTKDNRLCPNDTFVLNTETDEWEKFPATGDVPCARGGHGVVLNSKKRMLVFGGRSQQKPSLHNDLYTLIPDNMKWIQMQCQELPEPVEKATLCATGDQVLLLGGDQTSSHTQLAGAPSMIPRHGWISHVEQAAAQPNEAVWKKIEFTGPVPQRCNMSLTESPDGRYIFAFGGSDANGEATNDIFILNVDRAEWSVPEMVMGTKPPAREGHAAAIVGRFLIISGGWNEHGRLLDTYVLDTESMVWEALDTSLNQQGGVEVDRARCTVFSNDGHRIFMMVSSLGNLLDELITLDITIPEEAFQQNVLVRKELIQLEALQDENDMRQIKLGWRPPANSKARVLQYKVIMSLAGSAMVKEVYRGQVDSFTIKGAKAGKSYQFRVKGEYSDNSYIWSDICEIYMRQAGTEVVIPKQTIPVKGRMIPPAVHLRGGSLALKKNDQAAINASPPTLLNPGTVGYAAHMVKGRGPYH